ncbi:MAG TPA: 16S rRNA (cytosine(967)-C(5))-methyltransferase RsmB [Steroidobacteraceae bacterium]|nr:16S rRNA (cytosine(967)-C(5))-methyltransferase RsmB [Steroidobacteraceae bacterium]
MAHERATAKLTRLSTAALLAAAARTVTAVSASGQSLDDALARTAATLGNASDVAVVQALAYGTVRWYPRIDYWLTQLLAQGAKPKPALRALLAVGLHQLAFSSHPPHAVVDQAVDGARELGEPRGAGLVNAVLRRFLRERQRLTAAADESAPARFAHPAWLIEQIRGDWPDQWTQILDANNQAPPMWLRVNRRQASGAQYLEILKRASIGAQPGNHSADSVLLEVPVPVAALPGFESGVASVQDAGAQLAADLLAVSDGMRVLDACAAPGGKTCQLLERADLDLVAVDRSAERLEQLRDNLARLRLTATVIASDAADTALWWDGRRFERILLDAPCTASGVIRRHPDVKLLRRATDIEAMRHEQLRLLRALWPLLSDGGRLLYVTCSVLRAENEQVITSFLAEEPAAISVPIPEGFAPHDVRMHCETGVQILPGAAGMDGFYYACVEKRRSGASAGNPSA